MISVEEFLAQHPVSTAHADDADDGAADHATNATGEQAGGTDYTAHGQSGCTATAGSAVPSHIDGTGRAATSDGAGIAGRFGAGKRSETDRASHAEADGRSELAGQTVASGQSAGVNPSDDDDQGDDAAEPTWRRSAGGWAQRTTRTVDDPTDEDACKEAALRLLDAAPRASGTLRARLLDKGYAADTVDAVIDRLAQVRLLDDRAYAESTVRYCANRLMGRRGTVAELTRKGVDRTLAEQVVAQAEAAGVFEDAAWELGRRYANKTAGLDPAVRRRRFWSAGGRKGHSPDALRRVADELLN